MDLFCFDQEFPDKCVLQGVRENHFLYFAGVLTAANVKALADDLSVLAGRFRGRQLDRE
jgi:hypothetical protein